MVVHFTSVISKDCSECEWVRIVGYGELYAICFAPIIVFIWGGGGGGGRSDMKGRFRLSTGFFDNFIWNIVCDKLAPQF